MSVEYIKNSTEINDYQWCLEQAGAKVLAFKTFGSYQGDWFAKVEYEGNVFWINDYYGSCSGCDAFESDMPRHHDWDKGYEKDKVIEFGKKYLAEAKTFEEVLNYTKTHSDYDCEADDMLKFLEANK